MEKESFLQELERLLQDVPEEERQEALSYYRDYFEEAGEGREQEILESLGSPELVAAEIQEGLSGDEQAGEFTETGFHDERFEEPGEMPDRYGALICTGKRRGAGPGEGRQDGAGTGAGQETSNGAFGDAEGSRGAAQGERGDGSRKQKAEDAWNTARGSEWGRKAEDAWNTARGSEWGRKAEDAWNTARDSEWGRKAEDAWKTARGSRNDRSGKPVKRGGSRNWVLVILLLLFFGIPLAGRIISWVFSFAGGLIGVVFSILGGAVGAVAGVLGGLIGLICAGIGGIFAMGAAGVGLIATGVLNMAAPVIGVMLVGLGLLCFAAVFLLIVLVKWGITAAVPGVFRLTVWVIRSISGAIADGIKKIFGKRGRSDETFH